MTKWQEIVLRMLLDAGAEGVRYSHLSNNVDHLVRSHELESYLESLRVEHAVQKFRYGGAYYWRATDLLPSVV